MPRRKPAPRRSAPGSTAYAPIEDALHREWAKFVAEEQAAGRDSEITTTDKARVNSGRQRRRPPR